MGDANSPMGRKKSSSCVVEIITDEGLRGISLGGQNSIPQINSIFEEILINNDPKAVMSTGKMMKNFFKGGHDGILMRQYLLWMLHCGILSKDKR